MKRAILFLWQIALISAIYLVSVFIVKSLHIPVPAGVFGMVLLFALLSTGIIKLEYISIGAGFLNKHLGFFFIPIAVGLMNEGTLVREMGTQLFLMIFGSTIIGLLITAGLTHFLSKKEGKQHAPSNMD
ncbi:CidA/LrgA family protein [Falsibacillus pallidus]|uniref:Holin-like protein n=1 Tax=Falsibacillus pallidus TaxID=493781 RepID=A0A370GQX1_9BACI|nr:CidA/LrgA family protein [Falsibacillus pallidus]RDI45646.1 holin-like protein [Falsibacillus pallidus]